MTFAGYTGYRTYRGTQRGLKASLHEGVCQFLWSHTALQETQTLTWKAYDECHSGQRGHCDSTVPCRTENCWCHRASIWWWMTWSTIFFSKSPTIPLEGLLVTYQTESKSFLLLIAFVYCKFLLRKYSHRFASATAHAITFRQEYKIVSFWRYGSGVFSFFYFSFLLFLSIVTFFFSLIPIEICLILIKLTSWQPRRVHFPSLKTGAKQMLPGFPGSEPF